MISARPLEAALRVENRSNTRTGSSELSTVTAEPRQIRLVRPAMAPSTTSGAEIGEVRPMVLADAEAIDAEFDRRAPPPR